MNTVQLECFVSVAEHLNFSRASESLHVSQPAVSHQIQTLENELGVKLFKRTSKSVELTEEGMLFLADARYILKTAFDAKERLGKHMNHTAFDIGCHNMFEVNLLPSVFQQLHDNYPSLRPAVHFFPSMTLLNMIENKKLHAAFGFLEKEKIISALQFKKLYDARLVCVCSPQHPFSNYREIDESQLCGNFIACNPYQLPNTIFAFQNKLLSKTPVNQQFFTPNIESAFTMVKADIGYFLYPDIALMRDPGLCYVPVKNKEETIAFGLFYHRDNDHPILRSFLKYSSLLFKTEHV